MSKSQDIVARLRKLEGGGLRTFAEDPPLVWEKAEGCHVWDADGKRYHDLYGGFAVAAIGYGHPKVVAAIQDQAATLMHCPSAHPSRIRAEFYEALAGIAPAGLERFLPAVTGAMANEMAILLAHAHRPKGAIVSFAGSYFGRSIGTVGFAGKTKYRDALGIPAGGPFVPFPYPLRQGAAATDLTMQALEDLARKETQPIAAVMLEPIQGNGGVVIPPADFLPRLRQFCDREGALLILDEIQSGCGRTGRLWAVEHSGVTPDLMTVGKGIGGGVAVTAVMGRAEAMNWKPDSYTSTFLTNNLNLAAAIAAIGVLRKEQLAGRAAAIGPAGLARMRSALAGIEGVREVRGLGLWYAAELADAAWAGRAVKLARERGVIVGRSGYEDNVIKLSPALVIPEADLHAGIDKVAGAIRDSEGSSRVIEVKNYIGGKWVAGSGPSFESFNPATGETLSRAPVSGAAEVAAAVAAARRAFDKGGWRWTKGSVRAAALLKLADILEQRSRPISELIAREMGKPIRVNMAREVEGAVDKLRYFAGAARFLEGHVTGSTAPELWDMVLPEPAGVAALIIPWNDPVDLAVRKLGAALAAGCTTVVKSSEVTPASTAALIEAVNDSGAFPPGVVNLLSGPGQPTGDALVDHPGVDKISFTGSTATGMRIMERAAKRLAKVSLECGGKFPAIICNDADLERCLDAVTYGAFMYGGQSCTACTRLVVDKRLHDKVVEGVVARSKRLPMGDPLDPQMLVGPMASRKQYDKAVSYIRLGLAEGAKAALGGIPKDETSLFLPPTVLVGAPVDGRVAREEVFGPVLLIHPFEDEKQALAIANDTPYGLGGSVWSQDINRALGLARRLDVADVWINTHYIRHVETSFGGRHHSGLGRELGMAGVEEYLSWKRLCIDTRSEFHLKSWFEGAPR